MQKGKTHLNSSSLAAIAAVNAMLGVKKWLGYVVMQQQWYSGYRAQR